jgi:integrase
VSGLRTALGDYLTMRRALGFGLVRDEKLLTQFICYLEVHGKDTITVADTLDWVQLPTGAGQGWLNMRLGVVRGFAIYLHTLDPAVEIPPRGLLPGSHPRAVPYLYTDADIAALMGHAGRLQPAVRAATITTLIGLLAVTGLRIGEAIALDEADFDVDTGVLVIRQAKGGRQRLVPLHPSTVTALQAYQHQREQDIPHPSSPALFVSTVGKRLHYNDVSATYIRLVARAGLAQRPAPCRPRIHDLRHSFAVVTLLDWYRDGGGIASRLPLLSTYLGHVDPKQTYWYLEAAPELMAEAAHRLEPPPDTTGDPR